MKLSRVAIAVAMLEVLLAGGCASPESDRVVISKQFLGKMEEALDDERATGRDRSEVYNEVWNENYYELIYLTSIGDHQAISTSISLIGQKGYPIALFEGIGLLARPTFESDEAFFWQTLESKDPDVQVRALLVFDGVQPIDWCLEDYLDKHPDTKRLYEAKYDAKSQKTGEDREQLPGITNVASPQRLGLSEFTRCLQGLAATHYKAKVSSDEEMYRLKTAAAVLDPNESWPAILQLWAAGQMDYVQLLWWRKDDTETRAFIISLEWCMISVPRKGGPWPEGIDDYEWDAARFSQPERDTRIQEAAFVRENYAVLARGLSAALAKSRIEMAKRYEVAADVTTVDEIELVESLVPKAGEPQPDPHAAAIVALGRRAGPYLAEKLLDARDSKVFYGGQFRICDVANDLLADIYKEDPAEALIKQKPPLDAGHGYYFRDYFALTSTPEGRGELHDAWKKIIEKAAQKEKAG